MYIDHETKIIARLKAKFAADKIPVYPVAELERVPELRQKAPAVFVVYDGLTPGDEVGNGSVQTVTHEWYVVVMTRNAKGAGDPQEARMQAGAICQKALEALLGHHLGNGAYMRLAAGPGPQYDGGMAYMPLAFTTRASYRGDPT